MALVKVRWETTEQWEAEIEVDGYEPDCGYVEDSELAEMETDGPGGATFLGCRDRQVLEETVVREGDAVLSEEASKVRAPQYKEEF